MKLADYQQAHKTFLAAMKFFSSNKAKFRKYFSDRRLTLAEKNILKAKIEISKSNYAKALELLQVTAENDFIKAHLNYILGIVLNNSYQHQKATHHLTIAAEIFHNLGEKDYYFLSLYSLVMTYQNLKNPAQMDFHIQQMKKTKLSSPFDKACLLRCEAHYFSLTDKDSIALKKINSALTIEDSILKSRFAFFIVSKFLILFKMKHFKECEELLVEYKHQKEFVQSSTYNFMRVLLANFLHDEPIYIYKQHMKDAFELELQMNVIKHLSSAELNQAQSMWNQLMQINPVLYQSNFTYNGSYCLFSACLEKHNSKQFVDYTKFQKLRGKDEDKLFFILNVLTTPISKEDLIKLIWKEDFSPELSLKMNKLVHKTKKAYAVKIKVHKESYLMQKSGKKVA